MRAYRGYPLAEILGGGKIVNTERADPNEDEPDDPDEVLDEIFLVWEVWSVSPRGFRQSCKRIFPHEEWQFAEKLAERLRCRGHEDVEVELSTREGPP